MAARWRVRAPAYAEALAPGDAPMAAARGLVGLCALLLMGALHAGALVDARRSAATVPADWQARLQASAGERAARQSAMQQAYAALRASDPYWQVQWSADGAPALVEHRRGPLTPASTRSSIDIVREFLSAQRALYGLSDADLASLHVLGDSPGGRSGLRMLRIEQQLRGWPVFGTETRCLLDPQGRLWRTLGSLMPELATGAASADGAQRPLTEVLAALLGAGVPSSVQAAEPLSHFQRSDGAHGSARRVWFALAPGVLVPAWAITAYTADADWYAVVDAEHAQLLWQRDLRESASQHPARFSVYVQADGQTPADSPAPQSPSPALPGAGTQYPAISRSVVSMQSVQNLLASPNGWIDDCPGGADGCDSTRGNNVQVCLDRDATPDQCDAAALDLGGHPRGNPDAGGRNRDFLGTTPRDFDYTPAPLAANPDAGDVPTNPDYQRGAMTQLFYVANWYHDRLYALGFDEASGNFQQINPSGQGLGGDRVLIDAQNSGANNGNFSTPPDGAGPGRMQMYVYTGPNPDRDGGLDAAIVLHELTHGLSHRLVGNATGLLWDVARSMGEGWSDFYALSLLNAAPGDDPDAAYPFGSYISYRLSNLGDNYVYGYRRFPYSTNPQINPLSFADIDDVTLDESGGIPVSPLPLSANGALEVHNAGSIWALALWEIRSRIIAGAGGNVPQGNETMLQLVTDALKLTPSNPSFLDGREALLVADCMTQGCAHEQAIWGGFADRGLGYGAVAPLSVLGRFDIAHLGIGESFALPHLDLVDPALDVQIDDVATGNGDGRLDPGERARLRLTLHNPWRGRAASAIQAQLLAAAGVSVLDGQANYPDIAAMSAAHSGADSFEITLAPDLGCGQRLDFTLNLNSSLGAVSLPWSLRVGTPGAAGAQRVYSATPNLPIPDNNKRGVASHLQIDDDLEIADLDFRVDQLTHPVTGQLMVMLRAPNGYGSDLIWRRGGLMTPNQGLGADLAQVVIDDDLPLLASNDLNQSLSTQAPFSGAWLPAYNSPLWDSYATTPAVARDPVPQLARLDGSSTHGRWTVNVSDGNATATGTLQGWSLLVRPRSYQCSPFQAPLIFQDGFEAAVGAPTR